MDKHRVPDTHTLLDSYYLLNGIIDQGPFPMWISDAQGNLTRCNEALRKVLHVTSEELVGKYNIFKDNIIQEQGYMPLIQGVFERGETAHFELSYDSSKLKGLKLNKHVFLVLEVFVFPVKDDNGKMTHAVIKHVDITVRKNMEETLRQNEEKYRSIVDNIGIGVALISPQMEVLSMNKQMRVWNQQVITDNKPLCFMAFNRPPREEICSYCPTAKTLKDGQVHEAITETPDKGQIFNYRVISSPLFDSTGKIIAAIEMVEDITERKKIEIELEKRLRELEVFNKAAIGREERIIELKKELDALKSQLRKNE